MSAENKAIVRRLFEEAWNQRKPAVMDDLFAITAVDHDPVNPGVGRGPAGQKALLSKYTSAFPDMRLSIESIIAEGDLVAVRWSVRGTHQVQLEGIAATRQPVSLTGISIVRIAQGKIVESWNNWDALGMLQQLGVVARAQSA